MNTPEIEEAPPRSSTEIEGGIRATRKRMDSTLEKLSNRLTPRSLVNSAMDWWDHEISIESGNSGVKKTYRVLAGHIKRQPAPALLIGAGVAWLFLNQEEDSDSFVPSPNGDNRQQNSAGGIADAEQGDSNASGIMDTLKDKATGTKIAVSDLVDKAKDKTEALLGDSGEMKEKAGKVLDKGKHIVESKYHVGMERLRHAVDEYPLAVGAAFLALGALAGVVLPATRREDALLGVKSNQLVGDAKEKGEELLHLGKDKAGELGGALLAQAGDKGITAAGAGTKLSEITSQAGAAVRQGVEELGHVINAQIDPPSGVPANNPSKLPVKQSENI